MGTACVGYADGRASLTDSGQPGANWEASPVIKLARPAVQLASA